MPPKAKYLKQGILLFIFPIILLGIDPSVVNPSEEPEPVYNRADPLAKIGDYPYPTNPLNDRAQGFLLQGKVKNAVTNFGNYITWDFHPAGLWGDYTNLPHVAFLAGVPGHSLSSKYAWTKCGEAPDEDTAMEDSVDVWCSHDAYEAWYTSGDTNFVGIVFNMQNDCGNADGARDCGTWRPDSISKKLDKFFIDGNYQWGLSDDSQELFISIKQSGNTEINPNHSKARIGLVYPWGLRPKLKERTSDFDIYDYGPDNEEWTSDDVYDFYGANVTESWFTRSSSLTDTEWHASTMARVYSHDLEVTSGDIFADTPFSDGGDTYPLLAHSLYSATWPKKLIPETGELEPFWPGWWGDEYYGDDPDSWAVHGIVGCSGTRKDPDCWKEVPGRFISDNDVYMEFDDRWAHRSNRVNTNNEYEQAGYPMGLRVMSEAHTYGVAYAEDIMFVTVRVRNESGDWVDEDGVFHDGMIMPDGTKLNHGKGFNYKDIFLGFYMDADVVSADASGNFGVHTNADDYMKYHWERFSVKDDSMIVSMAMIGDYDGQSNIAYGYAMEDGTKKGNDFGIVATQMLDSPIATDPVDLDQDGYTDIYPGEPLKMTDWHWFDWYNRPGVVTRESNTNCCAGSPGRPQARNREEILLKVMSGDTTNLSEDEKTWFFHLANPDLPEDPSTNPLNPHFDSLDGLEKEDIFDDGLDCVLITSCGPFDFPVGEMVPFSFCIIFGEDEEDLKNNARFAQVMYNSHYQGFTPPTRPQVYTELDAGRVSLYWTDVPEQSVDVVTRYSDFEGYKIYKSYNGGSTWGGSEYMIFDDNGVHVGWRPIAQYDLPADVDSVFCVFGEDADGSCVDGIMRGHGISGPDPHTPWFSLGDDSGFGAIRLETPMVVIDPNGDTTAYHYKFVDEDVHDGMQYTYSVTSYDMGIERDYTVVWSDSLDGFQPDTIDSYSNPDNWASPDGYQNIECPRGTTVHDPNFVTVYPGAPPKYDLSAVRVVPNPYFARSNYPENEYVRDLHFTNLTSTCTISVFTVSGEKITEFEHDDQIAGTATWDLRTVNNQEIAPGLYIYAVESGSEKHIGKFVVVR
ncbi:MAG: hypothetical protein CMF83_00145 [Candidatus Marinimicrobia bacterium]|nr:hypothetical protein [Candidatus Neomarinimicrobiota bacterium]